jgi:outer membrane protein OmpA-like peptidoglycan-associated protein
MIRINYAAALVAAMVCSSCVTTGKFNDAMDEHTAALDAERNERAAADQQLAAADQQLASELAQLRNDLQAMRTEFGAKITAVSQGLAFVLPVHFSYDDSSLQSSDAAALDRFAQIVDRHYTGATVTVEGFADPAGSRAYNKRLSTQRAESVRGYLMKRNIAAQVRAVGYGEDRPVVPGASNNEAGAELNRRVVFVIESPSTRSAAVTALLN